MYQQETGISAGGDTEDPCLRTDGHQPSVAVLQADVPAAGGRNWEAVAGLMRSGFAAGNLVLLAGSGISAARPAGVPIAGPASAELTRRLLQRLGPTFESRARETIRTIPFEILMGRLAEIGREHAEAVVTELASITRPTRLHEQIGELCRLAEERHLRFNVVTPNYDCGIDIAGRERCVHPPRSVITADQARGDRLIFHVHGAAGVPSSYVLDFRGEFSLERWKRHLMRRILDGATLLILGFSGADLDVAEALVECSIRHVVWFRGDQGACRPERWPVAMQALADRVARRGGSMVAVTTDGHWGAALEPLTFPVSDADVRPDDARIAERYQRIVPVDDRRTLLDADLISLWARWTGLRAGYGELGTGLSAGERRQLRPRQVAEIESFYHYYKARYRTAGALQGRAARAALADGSLELFAYHRNLQAEYLNRGAYSPTVAAIVAATLVEAELRLLSSRRRPTRVLLGELIGLESTLILMWPFAATFALSARLAAGMRQGGRAAAKALERNSFQKATIIEMIASPPGSRMFQRAFERYVWHGQNARLINLRRLLALQALETWRRTADVAMLAEATDGAICATRWAASVDDPVRAAKCRLVLVEIAGALSRAVEPSSDTAQSSAWDERRETLISLLGPHQALEDAASHAWEALDDAELWPIARFVARAIFRAGGTPGSQRGLRVRLLGIAALESQ
jgi:hypothetical protein